MKKLYFLLFSILISSGLYGLSIFFKCVGTIKYITYVIYPANMRYIKHMLYISFISAIYQITCEENSY